MIKLKELSIMEDGGFKPITSIASRQVANQHH